MASTAQTGASAKIETGEMVYLRNTVEELNKEKAALAATAVRNETELKAIPQPARSHDF